MALCFSEPPNRRYEVEQYSATRHQLWPQIASFFSCTLAIIYLFLEVLDKAPSKAYTQTRNEAKRGILVRQISLFVFLYYALYKRLIATWSIGSIIQVFLRQIYYTKAKVMMVSLKTP